MTARDWNCHHLNIPEDLLGPVHALSGMPAASFNPAAFLAGMVGIDPWKIGALVGLLFFILV